MRCCLSSQSDLCQIDLSWAASTRCTTRAASRKPTRESCAILGTLTGFSKCSLELTRPHVTVRYDEEMSIRSSPRWHLTHSTANTQDSINVITPALRFHPRKNSAMIDSLEIVGPYSIVAEITNGVQAKFEPSPRLLHETIDLDRRWSCARISASSHDGCACRC